MDRLLIKTLLTAIPHQRAQKAEIGRGQWAAVHRHDPGGGARQPGGGVRVAAVRIVDHPDRIFWIGRQRNADSDQALGEQQGIRAGPGAQSRHVIGWAGGTINKPKEGIQAAASLKARLDVWGADSPAVLGLMARHTSTPICPQIGEEGIGGGLYLALGLK